jgi:uncharacterized protein YbjT (DUF2867 family)
LNILILGATGFIGSAIAARLVADGHVVTGIGRNPVRAARKQPAIHWARLDLSEMTNSDDWRDILKNQEVVVNCAGGLQDGLADDLAATQAKAMLALYTAARKATTRLVVQVSARTDGEAANLPFMRTKRVADEALASSGLSYVIIRPALVIGRNAHGGSALLRALAALPSTSPLIHAESPVDTISVDDVATAVSQAVSGVIPAGSDIDLASREGRLSLAELVQLHRRWLGLTPAAVVRMPKMLAVPVAWLADISGWLGWRSPLRSTAMAVMSVGVRSSNGSELQSPTATAAAILAANPSGVQDLWFARLYLLKALIIVGLSSFWLASGVAPLLGLEKASMHFLPFMTQASATMLTVTTCMIDIALGLAVLVRPFAHKALIAMITVSLAYLAGGSLLEPSLWLDPLGPLVKVLPSILLTMVALAILEER